MLGPVFVGDALPLGPLLLSPFRWIAVGARVLDPPARGHMSVEVFNRPETNVQEMRELPEDVVLNRIHLSRDTSWAVGVPTGKPKPAPIRADLQSPITRGAVG